MKKLGGSFIFWVILILFCLFYLRFSIGIQGIIKNRKKHIGEKVIIGLDTATIYKCNFWDNSYTLSNGSDIDFDLVEKLEKVK